MRFISAFDMKIHLIWFTGATCNVDTNDCVPDPCVHGTCGDQVDGYICSCDAGYEGDQNI